MKKLLWGIIGIPVAIGLIYGIGYILQFVFFLVQIDNTEFGFPQWLDITIDIIAGIFVTLFSRSLFNLSHKNIATLSTIISIIIGFIIGFVVHICLEYWYIILGVFALIVIIWLLIFLIKKHKKVIKEKMDDSI